MDNATDTLTTTTSLIQNYITLLENAKKELKENKAMLNDALSGDEEYRKVTEAAKEATKNKKAIYVRLMNNPTLAELNEKIKDLQSQVKENELAMSDLLQQYAQITGSKTFETPDGVVKDIIYLAKLVSPAK
jgi:hypothetical protein